MGTFLKITDTSGGSTVALSWPVLFGRGWSGRNGRSGTWCGRLIIISSYGGSGHRIRVVTLSCGGTSGVGSYETVHIFRGASG